MGKVHKISSVDAEKIVVRKMGFDFEDLPRHWFEGDVFLTQLINGLHFVFPEGERFFIRSARHFADQLPGELQARIEKFFGQEAQHQVEHIHAFRAIEAQGFEVRSFLNWYRALAYDVIEPLATPALCLAATSALEHYTSVLGEFALEEQIFDSAHPVMRDLLYWHACEEIEHKSVAFDVLTHVAPEDYGLRVRGFLMGSALLFFFWAVGLRHMLAQESSPRAKRAILPGKRARRKLRRAITFVAPRILEYLRPGFHPDDQDNYPLARARLEQMGRLAA